MFRDRTNLFITLRQAYKEEHGKAWHDQITSNQGRASFGRNDTNDEESRGLMSEIGPGGSGADVVIEMSALPPRWFDIRDDVQEILDEVAIKSVELDKLHQKHLLPGFDDEQVKLREEKRIERLTDEITIAFRKCHDTIKRIERMAREHEKSSQSVAQQTIARNLQIALATKVQGISAEFRKKQSIYLKKIQSLRGLSAPIGPNNTVPKVQNQNPYADASSIDTESDKQFSQTTLQQTSALRQVRQQQSSAANTAAITQREREVNEIAHGIIELADIFQSLQGMVIDQGTVLDRIDYNVENMARNVKGADKELKVATNYQRKYTKRKIMLLLILIIVGLFILLLIKPKRHVATTSNQDPASDTIASEAKGEAQDQTRQAKFARAIGHTQYPAVEFISLIGAARSKPP